MEGGKNYMRDHKKEEEDLKRICRRYDGMYEDSEQPKHVTDMYHDGNTYKEILKTREMFTRHKIIIATVILAIAITLACMFLW